MCGMVGKLNLERGRPPVTAEEMARMLAMIRHRGPDEFGAYLGNGVGLGSARLSIIDLSGGRQPIHNEDGTVWIVYNGEVFNYPELRRVLEAAGHTFYTDTDTEVIVHLYEERADFIHALNGQFALALWDSRRHELLLARDRVGIRPLYYATAAGRLLFASEIKALLADPLLQARLSLLALAETFTFWSPLSPHSPFEGILSLPPGHLLRVREGQIILQRYWALDYTVPDQVAPVNEAAEELRALLADAARIRLRADVPVGVYLSGGLDSSTTAALVKQYAGARLRTFGLAFEDPAYDERAHQAAMVRHLDTDHSQVECATADIAAAFPDVVWHAEAPLLRTSPAPMYLLANLVHRHGFKVVLTGEGADEILGGYNIFKEARIRRFWARRPDSTLRPQLLARLYPYIARLSQENPSYLRAFFGQGLEDTGDPLYSHRLRWRNTARCQRFFTPEVAAAAAANDPWQGWPTPCHPNTALGALAQAQNMKARVLVRIPAFLPG
jgi:asparagine synthase (glutamine-hydrolysing)